MVAQLVRQRSNSSEELVADLSRLRAQSRGRVPFIPQLSSSDCGIACLAMALAVHGRFATLDEIQSGIGGARGTDAGSLLRAARVLGLRGRGVQIDLPDLRLLPRGTILHWRFKHFVVLERVRGQAVDIVDPSVGRRRLTMASFERYFTGVAIVFEPTEEFVRGGRPPSVSWWHQLSNVTAHRSLIAQILIISVVLRVIALALPLLTAVLINEVIPNAEQQPLVLLGCGAFVAVLAHGLTTLIRAHLLLSLRTRMDRRMTVSFLSKLMKLPYAYFTRKTSADLMLRVRSHNKLRDTLASSLVSGFLDGLMAIGYIGLLVFVNLPLASATAALAVLHALLILATSRRFLQLAFQDLEIQTRSNSHLLQLLAGIETVKAAGAEEHVLQQWSELYSEELALAHSKGQLTASVEALGGLLEIAGPFVLLGIGASQVMSGNMSLGAMFAAIALANGFLQPAASMVRTARQLQSIRSHVDRIAEVASAPPEQVGSLTMPRLKGRLELKDVSFRYGPDQPLILRDVTLTIEPGELLAIVGQTGSGKSTLLALLLGLYEPTEGRILYDGNDIRALNRRELRAQIGMVPQDPFIFNGTIRSNITFATPDAPMPDIVEAARLACIHDEVSRLTLGYETPIADRGATLSGGQRQRLALARALIKRPRVMILDEATSSLDVLTEARVFANLRELTATRIVVAHRLSTITSADKIVVLDQGRVVEQGGHGELTRAGGIYSTLTAGQGGA